MSLRMVEGIDAFERITYVALALFTFLMTLVICLPSEEVQMGEKGYSKVYYTTTQNHTVYSWVPSANATEFVREVNK